MSVIIWYDCMGRYLHIIIKEGEVTNMGLLDKVKDTAMQAKDSAAKFAEEKGIAEKVSKATDSIKSSIDETKANMQAHKEASAEAKKPLEGCIQWYEVMYEGGLATIGAEKTKAGSGSIGMNILPDSFYFKPTITAIDWFEDLEIPYDKIKKFELIKRTVGNAEMFLASSATDAASLATLNTMAITYDDNNGDEVYLKMEMLTGLSVQGQAKKCEEMMDVLRTNKILPRLNKDNGSSAPVQQLSAADELKKYKDLLDSGIINQDEFDAKKKQLLGL